MVRIIEEEILGQETIEEHKIIEDNFQREYGDNYRNSNFDGVEVG